MFWDEEEMKDQERKRHEDFHHHKRVRRARRRGRPAGSVKRKKRSTKKRWIVNVAIVLFVCVFLYSAYRLYNIFTVYYHNWQIGSELRELYYDQQPSSVAQGEEDSNQREQTLNSHTINPLAPLQAINPDVRAWIRIEDTDIDYPVVQGADNDYYLDHNLYNEYTICGSIFMDYRNHQGALRENYILYGHRMKDDSMFGELSKYLKEDFFDSHRTFTLTTADTTYTCEIFAVYQTTTDRFAYGQPQFTDENAFTSYINTCRGYSMYQTDVEIAPTDSIITLSTCDYELDVNTGRLVVQAKLIPPQTEETLPEESTDGSVTEDGAEGDGGASQETDEGTDEGSQAEE